jgi:channel protein (hemolysin III family)
VLSEVAVTSIPGFYEPLSSLSHLLAGVVFLPLGVIFIASNRGGALRTTGVSVFVSGVVFLLSMSGIYHLLPHGTAGRAVLERLDHAAIFVLIAATFTPVHMISFRGFSRWRILLVVWVTAITGLTLKTLLFEEMSEGLGLLLYLGLGWVGAWTAYLLYRQYGARHLTSVYIGALAYDRVVTGTTSIIRTHTLQKFKEVTVR